MKSLLYIITVLALLLFNSCEKFIDLKPLDKISTNDYWNTTTDLKNYMLQFYPATFSETEMVNRDNNSDNVIQTTPDVVMHGQRVKSTGNWMNQWTNIRNVNIFLENYKKCKDDINSYKHYVGEAHFFRAMFYFNLLKMYGNLPWYSKSLQIDSEQELMRPRDPRTLIVDSILVDLDKAALYLKARTTTGNNQLNKEAALAFKTRVALYEGTWQKYHANDPFGTTGANPNKYFQACIDAAEELMSGNYKVGIYNTGNPDKDYYQLFGLDNMSAVNEVLFYRAFNAADGLGNIAQYLTTFYAYQKGFTWELVSSYLKKDGQPYDYLGLAKTTKGNAFLSKIATDCDPRLKSTIWIPGDLMSVSQNSFFTKPTINLGGLQLCTTGFQVKKTSNPSSRAAGLQWDTPAETGLIFFRYGEVLLNYAEAKYELNNTVAYTQLNLLRQRAGMPNFIVNPQSSDLNPVNYGYTISDELYEIRRERRVELALEGFRAGDYMRWAAHSIFKGKRSKGYPFSAAEFPNFIPRLDENSLIDYFANQMPNGYNFREGQDYLYSIPQDELTFNPNLLQNPGW